MEKTELFKINGQPLIIPDAGVGFSFEDLDDATSGRDESGYMHRFVVRRKVGKWSFYFSSITEEEKNYLESLLRDSDTFPFTHPSRENSNLAETTTCYCSKTEMSWYNARLGVWKNYKFNVIEC